MAAGMPEACFFLHQPDNLRTPIRNNAGGHANHAMFWTIMGGKGGAPSGDLAAAIDRDFGSFDKLKEGFNRAGLTQFGSGWVHVTVDKDGKLAMGARPNQDNPIMKGTAEVVGAPVLGLDVWEHAYYLKYQNRRPDYITAWFNVVNWDDVAAREKIITDTSGPGGYNFSKSIAVM